MSTFRFKQFEIKQDKCAMKIGTDGVLLGAWANVVQASAILDIGTGTGLLALMSAQRNATASIDAIEIETAAYLQATENIANSPWNNRIKTVHQSIQEFSNLSSRSILYDSIISNPPYFKIEANSQINNKARRQARSTDSLSFEALLSSALQLLSPNGNFSVILPKQEGQQFIQLALEKGFYLRQEIEVIPRVGKTSNRLLIELVLQPTNSIKKYLTIRLEGKKNHDYTEEFQKLHKDFLLFL